MAGTDRAASFGAATALRTAKWLVGVMLAIKIAVTLWNAVTYDSRDTYDYYHHATRAFSGGLTPGKMNYDGPLYYLPALAFVKRVQQEVVASRPPVLEKRPKGMSWRDWKLARRRADKAKREAVGAELLTVLRYTNVFYVAVFYLCWVCVSLPRLLPDVRGWFLASVLLLALPGYQKLGVMAHADNLFAATSAVCAAAWLMLRRRASEQAEPVDPVDKGWWLGLPLLAGLVGMSRPFAVVPVLLFAGVACLHALAGRRFGSFGAFARVVAALAIAGTLSSGWYAYRWANSGAVTEAYNQGYIAKYVAVQEGFDFVHYFTSFKLDELLACPNRKGGSTGPGHEPVVANSFFTLLYSETWGDHWLCFSGARNIETKLWQKRVLLAFALPIPFMLLVGAARSARALARRARASAAESPHSGFRRWADVAIALEAELVIAAWLVFGVALYLAWQTGPALLPGKNSTIKFIYAATFYPLAIVLASLSPPRGAWFKACAAYLVALYVIALPVAVFVPATEAERGEEPVQLDASVVDAQLLDLDHDLFAKRTVGPRAARQSTIRFRTDRRPLTCLKTWTRAAPDLGGRVFITGRTNQRPGVQIEVPLTSVEAGPHRLNRFHATAGDPNRGLA